MTRDQGAVGILHSMGIDPWVVDFGSPDSEEGGWDRNLADHIVAISEIIDQVRAHTGRDVYLSGYSQGGMFAYQAAAYRRSRNIAGLVTFGSPVDTLAGLPFGIPAGGFATDAAGFLADHVFNRLAVSGVDGAHRFSAPRSRKNAEVEARLPASVARPGSVVAAGAAAAVPRDRGLGGVVRSGCCGVAQAVHRAQPHDDRRVRDQGPGGVARGVDLPHPRVRRGGRRHRSAVGCPRYPPGRPTGECVRINFAGRTFRPRRRFGCGDPHVAHDWEMGAVERGSRPTAHHYRAHALRRTFRQRIRSLHQRPHHSHRGVGRRGRRRCRQGGDQ